MIVRPVGKYASHGALRSIYSEQFFFCGTLGWNALVMDQTSEQRSPLLCLHLVVEERFVCSKSYSEYKVI